MTPDIDAFIVEESVKYKGLSLRDTSRKVVAEMGETGQVMKVAWAMEIEKAIIAAIEADRASRECCKAEREACAKLCEGESFNNQSDYSIACEDLAKLIRARSEKGD